jgi:hypothetical protein
MFGTIIKIANRAPWNAEHTLADGVKGYWIENSDGHMLFINDTNGKIHLPKALRGKLPETIRPADFDTLDPEDTGKAHYSEWKKGYDTEKAKSKLWDNYGFTNEGQVLVDRLKKFIIKNHLDDVTQLNLGLEPKYSINLDVFDKLLNTPQIDRVGRLGRTIGKKYRLITAWLSHLGKIRLVNKLDRDFFYHWNKLASLFDIDLSKYKPEIDSEIINEDVTPQETADTIKAQLLAVHQAFLSAIHPLLDPQMSQFIGVLDKFNKDINSNQIMAAQSDFELMSNILMHYIGRAHMHSIGRAAEAILHLPEYILMHDKLFNMPMPLKPPKL